MLGILAVCVLALFCGYLLLRGFGIFVTREDGDKLEESIYARRGAATKQRREILEQIGKPECSDGSLSPRQQALWDEYRRLEAENNRLTRQEDNALIDAGR